MSIDLLRRLQQQHPRWKIFVTPAGRLWAWTKTTIRQLHAGCRGSLDADTPQDLELLLREQDARRSAADETPPSSGTLTFGSRERTETNPGPHPSASRYRPTRATPAPVHGAALDIPAGHDRRPNPAQPNRQRRVRGTPADQQGTESS